MISAFAYKSPKTIEQVIGALGDSWGKTEILAGGTDLVNMMKEGLAEPAIVVSLKKISDLSGIMVGDAEIKIGATTTPAQIAEHSAVRKHLPALALAADFLGTPQIRNMGTLGGSLCQRNRDWYFRLGLTPSVREETQYGAIFPIDGADYVHPSTSAPALIAYGASVQIAGAEKRSVPIEAFFQVSDLKSKRETVLKPNELVTGVTIPVGRNLKSADYDVRERDSHDWPLVQASVALQMDGDKVASAVIALGHVSPLPMRANGAEQAITGKVVDIETAAAAGKAAVAGAKPTPKNAYKVTLAQVAVKRALLAAVGNSYWTKNP